MFNQAGVDDLQAALDPEMPIYVLIDPLLGEPLPTEGTPDSGAAMQAARAAMWGRKIVQIELSPKIKLAPYHFPYLVALEGMGDPLLETTLEIAHSERLESQADGLDGEGAASHCIGGWLQSTMKSPVLSKHVSSMFDLSADVWTKATYLRLADRRTFALLRHLVGDASIGKKMDQLRNWVYLDAQGSISSLQSGGEPSGFIRIKAEPWERLQEGEALNRAMAIWLGEARRNGQAEVGEQPAHTLYEPLFNALANARQAAARWPHRFIQPLDQSVWAALLMLYPKLDSSPQSIQLLQDTGTKDEPAEPLRHLHRQITALMPAAAKTQFTPSV